MSPKSAQRFWDNDVHKTKTEGASIEFLDQAPSRQRLIVAARAVSSGLYPSEVMISR
jgi:hypothetical protein